MHYQDLCYTLTHCPTCAPVFDDAGSEYSTQPMVQPLRIMTQVPRTVFA